MRPTSVRLSLLAARLELGDLPAHRRLWHAEGGRSAANAAGLYDPNEHHDFIEVCHPLSRTRDSIA
jgi:hypothetical protein